MNKISFIQRLPELVLVMRATLDSLHPVICILLLLLPGIPYFREKNNLMV